jgi:4,5-dihydroxyphthalate decarboxylase
MSICAVPGDIVDPLISGSVKVEGISLAVTRQEGSTAYWRQLKFAEFQVSVMSVTSYIIAKAHGLDFVGLPVFASRRFMHADSQYHVDSGIKTPSDLAGKRVGIGEYQQTASIWFRGVLEHDFGVSQYDVNWYMERSEELSHGGATGFTPPERISFQRVPVDKSLASMLVNHEIDAAPVGRAQRNEPANVIDRSTRIRAAAQDWSKVKPLFPDQMEEGVRFFNKYGCIPATQMYIIRGDVDREYPWAALNLYQAFLESKRIAQETMRERMPNMLLFGAEYAAKTRSLFGDDYFPFGVKANRQMIETLSAFAQEQGLIPEQPKMEDLFAQATLDL